MRLAMKAVVALLMCGGCGGAESSDSVEDAGPSDARANDAGATGASGNHDARPAQITLTVDSGRAWTAIGPFRPGNGDVFIDLSISFKNDGETRPIELGTRSFLLGTSDALLYFSTGATFDLTPPCRSDVLLGLGALYACRIAFDIPSGATPTQLSYSDDLGRSVTTDVPVVSPPTI